MSKIEQLQQESLAIVFPGQGSQAVGMLQDLSAEYREIKVTFDEASDVLGYDLNYLIQNGPEDKLNQTEFTQPALLASGVALWRVWQNATRVTPAYLAGHSLGEYTSLVCAESISFSDAIRLVAARGRLMQNAYHGGAMLAVVGLSDELVVKLCDQSRVHGVLEVANYNSVGQTVLAGDLSAIQFAESLAKELGAKIAKVLPVSVPSHCSLMKPAALELSKLIGSLVIKEPKIPVINNVRAEVDNLPSIIGENLVKQIYSPVRWFDTVKFMVNNGVKSILECGPGKVLTGLNKRISSDITVDYLGGLAQLRSYII